MHFVLEITSNNCRIEHFELEVTSNNCIFTDLYNVIYVLFVLKGWLQRAHNSHKLRLISKKKLEDQHIFVSNWAVNVPILILCARQYILTVLFLRQKLSVLSLAKKTRSWSVFINKQIDIYHERTGNIVLVKVEKCITLQ